MLTPSDITLVACLVPAFAFAILFFLGIRGWYRDALGWTMFLYALSVLALLGLIVFGIVFGQKVDEVPRMLVAGSVFLAMTAKLVLLIHGRIIGHRERVALLKGKTNDRSA